VAYGSYVAIGDSFTEGIDDPDPSGAAYRGWADLVAVELAARHPGFRYANLAVRGRLLGPIVRDQLPAAVALAPELISIAGGTNDILRRSCDPPGLARQIDDAIGRLRATGADVVVFTGIDPTRRQPSTRRLLPRIDVVNHAVRHAAETHGALLVDLWSARAFDDPRLWSDDRLHLNARGHREVADMVLDRLGIGPESRIEVGGWRQPLGEPPPPPRWVAARLDDLRWARRHFAPWVYRRLTGRSSGDAVTAKRPDLAPLGDGHAPSRP
jgi:lysophospholipase L1-like esterase